MVNSLRKVDFSHPTGHYTWKKILPPPLEKILGAPLNSQAGTRRHADITGLREQPDRRSWDDVGGQ